MCRFLVGYMHTNTKRILVIYRFFLLFFFFFFFFFSFWWICSSVGLHSSQYVSACKFMYIYMCQPRSNAHARAFIYKLLARIVAIVSVEFELIQNRPKMLLSQFKVGICLLWTLMCFNECHFSRKRNGKQDLVADLLSPSSTVSVFCFVLFCFVCIYLFIYCFLRTLEFVM